MNDRNKQERAFSAMTKQMVVNCVRNTMLEQFHAGHAPVTKTKDASDIKVIDAEGTEYRWHEVSRITDPEMKECMKQIVNRIYTFLNFYDDPEFQVLMAKYNSSISKWDAPVIDKAMLGKKLTEKLCKKS